MIVTSFSKSVVDRKVLGELKRSIKNNDPHYSPSWFDEMARNLDRHTEKDFRPVGESPIVTRAVDLFTATNKDNPELFHLVKEEIESWLSLQYFQTSSGRMKPAFLVTDQQREMIAAFFNRINE